MEIEYTGQCVGGPDEGNLITATVVEVAFRVEYTHALDGPAKPACRLVITGSYLWDPSEGVFRWRAADVRPRAFEVRT